LNGDWSKTLILKKRGEENNTGGEDEQESLGFWGDFRPFFFGMDQDLKFVVDLRFVVKEKEKLKVGKI